MAARWVSAEAWVCCHKSGSYQAAAKLRSTAARLLIVFFAGLLLATLLLLELELGIFHREDKNNNEDVNCLEFIVFNGVTLELKHKDTQRERDTHTFFLTLILVSI